MSKRKRLPLPTEVTQLLLIDGEEQDSDNDSITEEVAEENGFDTFNQLLDSTELSDEETFYNY